MKINEFASEVARREGGKKSVDVAQVKEILKIVNGMLFGLPYLMIRLRPSKFGKREATTLAVAVFVSVAVCVALLHVTTKLAEPAEMDCMGNTRPVAVIEVR